MTRPEGADPGVQVRLQVEPSSAKMMASALARRGDVAWVRIVSAGSEIVCGAVNSDVQQRNSLLMTVVPANKRILGIRAHTVLHHFRRPRGPDWDGYRHPLTASQVDALSVERGSAGPADATIDASDKPLLDALAIDARATSTRLAQCTRRSQSAVLRRMEALLQSGAIAFEVDVAPEVFGLATSAILYLDVAPASLHATGAALAEHRETSYVAAVSGDRNLLCSVWCRDIADLYRYVSVTVASIADIRAIEVCPVVEHVKHTQTMRSGGRLSQAPG